MFTNEAQSRVGEVVTVRIPATTDGAETRRPHVVRMGARSIAELIGVTELEVLREAVAGSISSEVDEHGQRWFLQSDAPTIRQVIRGDSVLLATARDARPDAGGMTLRPGRVVRK
ncbi:MAG: hypothetical protein NTY19_11645 [Planctomycetota bacterium]|nr:hypothetical protein [Planctomycetota bacterium]